LKKSRKLTQNIYKWTMNFSTFPEPLSLKINETNKICKVISLAKASTVKAV